MSFNKKIIAITPMVCLIIYLTLGFVLQNSWWGWGLFIFLLVPLMPYILRIKKFHLSVPFAITLIYLSSCFIAQALGKSIWHPMWIIFLFIPVIEILKTPGPKKSKINKKDDNETEYVDSKVE